MVYTICPCPTILPNCLSHEHIWYISPSTIGLALPLDPFFSSGPSTQKCKNSQNDTQHYHKHRNKRPEPFLSASWRRLAAVLCQNGPTSSCYSSMSFCSRSPSNNAPNVNLSKIYPEQVFVLKTGGYLPSSKDPKRPWNWYFTIRVQLPTSAVHWVLVRFLWNKNELIIINKFFLTVVFCLETDRTL